MPRYRAKRMCFIDGGRVRKGAVITADFKGGNVPSYLMPLSEGDAVKAATPEGGYEAVHKGNGKWAVIAPDGKDFDTGLGKLEAHAKADELNTIQPEA